MRLMIFAWDSWPATRPWRKALCIRKPAGPFSSQCREPANPLRQELVQQPRRAGSCETDGSAGGEEKSRGRGARCHGWHGICGSPDGNFHQLFPTGLNRRAVEDHQHPLQTARGAKRLDRLCQPTPGRHAARLVQALPEEDQNPGGDSRCSMSPLSVPGTRAFGFGHVSDGRGGRFVKRFTGVFP